MRHRPFAFRHAATLTGVADKKKGAPRMGHAFFYSFKS